MTNHFSRSAYIILLAAAALLAPARARSAASSHFATGSVLSQGRWVKVRVDNTGMQQITYSQLREWGFDDPAQVTVFGFGGLALERDNIASMPTDIPQQPVIYLDDKLVFYGEGNHMPRFMITSGGTDAPTPTSNQYVEMERNTAADAGYYLITDSQPRYDLEANAVPYKPDDRGVLANHYCMMAYEEDRVSPNSAGKHFYGPSLGQDEVFELSFPLTDRDIYVASNYIYFDMTLASHPDARYFAYTYTRHTTADYPATYLVTASSSDITTKLVTGTQRIAAPVHSSMKEFRFTLRRDDTSATDYAGLDQCGLFYNRYNRLLDEPSLMLRYRTVFIGNMLRISEYDPSQVVWDIQTPHTVRPMAGQYDADAATLTLSPDRNVQASQEAPHGGRFMLFRPAATHNSVSYAGEVANQNLHALQTPDFLIISSALCRPQAERLADIHRNLLGQETLVISQEEIFNEFSSGTPSVQSLRHFVKMLYDRNPGKLQALLLFGGGTYDNGAILDSNKANHAAGALLMTYPVADRNLGGTSSKSFTTDAYFGMLSDTFYPYTMYREQMKVSVGRLPVMNQAEAQAAVDKIVRYLTVFPTTDTHHRVLLVADSGNTHSHLNSSEKIAKKVTQNYSGFTTIKGYDALYPWGGGNRGILLQNYIIRSLQTGVGFLNYTGHGDPVSLSGRRLWDIDTNNRTDYDSYPMAMFATCDAYSFDRNNTSLCQAMVMKDNGGVIGMVGACRSVYEVKNQKLNQAVVEAYAAAGETTKTGDVFRIGRNNAIAADLDIGMAYNTLCYNYCGDPALPVYAAKANIKVSSVDGKKWSLFDDYYPSATHPVTVEGYIDNGEGEPDATFDGTVIATYYESEVARKTHTSNDTEVLDILTDEDQLAQTVAEVKGGRFTVTLISPPQTRQGETNRLTLYAYNTDRSRASKGYIANIVMRFANESEITDRTAPVISDLYIDTPGFVSGDAVGQDCRLMATISPDESGLNTADLSIGTGITVNIDGNRSYNIGGSALTINHDGSYTVNKPLSSLADGRHTMTLTVTDNSGNTASRSIDCVVTSTPATAALAVEETPARIQATLTLEHSFTEAPAGNLIIEDLHGRHILSRRDVTFPFEWDLTDTDGNLVPDGIYRAHATLRRGFNFATTPKIDINVIQKQ